MAFIRIYSVDADDFVDVATPASFSVSFSDIDGGSTTRSESGVMQRDRIREGVRKVSCKWNALKQPDAQALLALLRPDQIQIEYPDPETAVRAVKSVFVGDRSNDMVLYQDGAPRWNISCEFTEY